MPWTCPKCGVDTTQAGSSGAKLRAHLLAHHPQSAGTAYESESGEARDFVYVRPVEGEGGKWYVVWLDWPYEVAKLDTQRFRVVWAVPGQKEAP